MDCPCEGSKPPVPEPPKQEEKRASNLCACSINQKKADGLVRIKNPNIQNMKSDCLYHLSLDTVTQDLQAMFGDVKFVCMGGSADRMEHFANFIKDELQLTLPCGTSLTDISKLGHRYALYKVGPIIAVSHGMGVPSMSILLHELLKLMYYAKAKNPVFFRLGTCGGLGVPPGTVVISDSVCDTSNRDCQEVTILGYPTRRPAKLDQKLANRLKKFARSDDGYETVIGKTMCTLDFYEEQARLDGAYCEISKEDKMTYLERLKSLGVVNIEMEGIPFAALTHNAGVQAGMVCVAIINRLAGDQIDAPKEVLEEQQLRPQVLVGRYIKKYFEKLAEKKERMA